MRRTRIFPMIFLVILVMPMASILASNIEIVENLEMDAGATLAGTPSTLYSDDCTSTTGWNSVTDESNWPDGLGWSTGGLQTGISLLVSCGRFESGSISGMGKNSHGAAWYRNLTNEAEVGRGLDLTVDLHHYYVEDKMGHVYIHILDENREIIFFIFLADAWYSEVSDMYIRYYYTGDTGYEQLYKRTSGSWTEDLRIWYDTSADAIKATNPDGTSTLVSSLSSTEEARVASEIAISFMNKQDYPYDSKYIRDIQVIGLENEAPEIEDTPTCTNPAKTDDLCIGLKHIFTVGVEDLDGYSDIDYIELGLTDLNWRVRYTESTDTFSEYYDPGDYVTLDVAGCSYNKLGYDIDITFTVAFHYSYPTANNLAIKATVVDDPSASDTEFSSYIWDVVDGRPTLHGVYESDSFLHDYVLFADYGNYMGALIWTVDVTAAYNGWSDNDYIELTYGDDVWSVRYTIDDADDLDGGTISWTSPTLIDVASMPPFCISEAGNNLEIDFIVTPRVLHPDTDAHAYVDVVTAFGARYATSSVEYDVRHAILVDSIHLESDADVTNFANMQDFDADYATIRVDVNYGFARLKFTGLDDSRIYTVSTHWNMITNIDGWWFDECNPFFIYWPSQLDSIEYSDGPKHTNEGINEVWIDNSGYFFVAFKAHDGYWSGSAYLRVSSLAIYDTTDDS